MNRRDFIALTAGTAALGAMPLWADPLDYTEGLVAKHLAAGETVFLDFKASWCSTCAAQERVIDALKAGNPGYEQAVTFINIDWDDYGRSDLVKRLRIPRRSTLVVLKGESELGRIVAQTDKDSIQQLMDVALSAADKG